MNTQQAENLTDASAQWANRPADQRFETLEALRASVAERAGKLMSMIGGGL